MEPRQNSKRDPQLPAAERDMRESMRRALSSYTYRFEDRRCIKNNKHLQSKMTGRLHYTRRGGNRRGRRRAWMLSILYMSVRGFSRFY